MKNHIIKWRANCLLFLILFLISVCQDSFSGDYSVYFNHLTTLQGLPSNRVYCILEDSEGFMWFGTEDGLSKWDGYRFAIFRHIPGNEKSLSHFRINCMLEEPATGNIWIGNDIGLDYFIKDNYEFKHIKLLSDSSHRSDHVVVHHLAYDQEGNLWIGTKKGLFVRIKDKMHEFVHRDTVVSSLIDNNVNHIYADRNNNIFISTENGLDLYNSNDKSFKHLFKESNLSLVQSVYQDFYDKYWICTDRKGLYHVEFFPEERIINHYSIDDGHFRNNRVHRIIEDQKNNLFIMVRDDGLYYYDRINDTIVLHEPDLHDPASLSSKALISIYKGTTGNIWLGTFNTGVDYIDYNRKKFRHVYVNFNETGLFNQKIRSFFQDSEGKIWIGTKEGGGLSLMNLKDETFTHYLPQTGLTGTLSSDYIFAINEIDDENLIIGTFGKGIDIFNKNTGKFLNFQHKGDIHSISDDRVYCIHKDPKNNIWLGTYEELNIYFPGKKQFQTINNFKSVRSFLQEDENHIWMGTKYDGLILLNTHDFSYTKYIHILDDSTSISNDDIVCLGKDKVGNLWVGTRNGLNRFEKKNEIFTSYHEEDGLPNNWICGLQFDEEGNVWFSTKNGLCKFNPKDKIINNYFLEDGLQSNEFESYVSLKTNNGYIFFGGINGFNYFKPEQIHDNTNIPNIVITKFFISNKEVKINDQTSVLEKHISRTRELYLNHDQADITFEFAALNFTSPEKNQYKYKLEGFDKNWINSGNIRRATYTNLQPGKYVFRVTGSNNDHYWNKTGASIGINVQPPYWKTFWAYGIYLIIIALMFWGIRYLIFLRMEQKNILLFERLEKKQIQEINEMRLRFFTNISHEFRTPLTLISGPLEKLMNYNSDNEEHKYLYRLIYNNVKRLLILINQLMDFRKVENDKFRLHVAQTDIAEFMQHMIECFEEHALQKDIKLTLKNCDPKQICWIDRSIFDKVIYNLLSNAFKFTTKGGEITLSVTLKNDHLEFAVSDTGIGISEEEQEKIFGRFYRFESTSIDYSSGTGIGLAFTKRLVEAHKGEISLESSINSGSKFIVVIPVTREFYREEEIMNQKSFFISGEKDYSLYQPQMNNSSLKEDKSTGERFSLLIVEDDDEMKDFRSHLFHKFDVISASDGIQGIKLAREIQPDIILSDVMMSKMDGIELCKKLKTDFATSHIPVILLTAKTTVASRIEGIETGADDYIDKPFDTRFLLARVDNLIEQRKKLRKIFSNNFGLDVEELDLTLHDKKFLNKALSIITENIDNHDFTVESLGFELNLSRSQLFRKFKALGETTPSEIIRIERLKFAAKLLKEGEHNINEVCYSAGFTSPSYFITSFKKMFGITPKEYMKK